MDKLGRQGHRQRVKSLYLKSGLDAMPDHNVLELVLFYAIPQRDVKQIAYELINRFGSLENVFGADISELEKVDGVSTHTAILIKLFNDVGVRLDQNKAKNARNFESVSEIKEYAALMLGKFDTEKVLVVTLGNDYRIINHHILEGEGADKASISKKEIAEIALRDNAVKVLIAHNHPGGDATPSAADVAATQNLTLFLRQLGVPFLDHIIVGKDNSALSMKLESEYSMYFDD